MEKGPNQIIEEIKKQIGKNEINSAIQNLKLIIQEYANDDNLFNSVITIENDNARLHSSQIKGIMTSEQYNVSHNRLINSLLDSVQKTKKNISENERLYHESQIQIEYHQLNQNEKWRKYSKFIQEKLAYKGEIQIQDPVNDFQLYYYNKKGELFKKHSLVGQLQFIDLQKAVAKREANHKRKLSLYSIVCALYEQLESVTQDYLIFKVKEETIWKGIASLFRKDLVDYTPEDKLKITNLKNESHKFYNKKRDELSNIAYEQNKRKDFKETVIKIQKEVVDKKKNLESFIVAIPGEYANWFSNGYLWYCNNCKLQYTNWFKGKGEWIEIGNPILSQYSKGIFSPFSGLLIRRGATSGDNPLWYMIPEKGTDISTFKPSFVYGELIDYVHKQLNNGKTFSKYSKTDFDMLIKRFDDEKLEVTEFDNETKEILIASGIKI